MSKIEEREQLINELKNQGLSEYRIYKYIEDIENDQVVFDSIYRKHKGNVNLEEVFQLREVGKSYREIAKYYTDKGIPISSSIIREHKQIEYLKRRLNRGKMKMRVAIKKLL